MTLLVGTFRGALWNAAGSWTQVGLNVAGFAVVARVPGPETCGIVGLAIVSPATVRGAGGLVGAVLRRDDRALAAGLGESR